MTHVGQRARRACAALAAAISLLLGFASAAQAVTPDISFWDKPPARTNSKTINWGVSSSNVDVTYSCTMTNWYFADPGCTTQANRGTSMSMSVPQEGSHTLTVTATAQDGSGNQKTISTTWTSDFTAPNTTIESGPRFSDIITGHTATWSFSSSETGGYECALDDAGYTACANPYTLDAIEDGDHVLHVRASDQAGNVDGSPANASFSVNNQPPVAAFTYTPPGTEPFQDGVTKYTANPQDIWYFGVSRPDATTECRLDDEAWSSCTGAFVPATPLADGTHTVRVRAVLAASSYVQDPPSQSTVVVDTTAPDTSFAKAPPAAAPGSTVTFAYAASEPGVQFACKLDDVFQLSACPTEFDGLAAGEHTLEVWAIDRAFNEDSTPATRTWTSYPTAPDTVLTGAPDADAAVAKAIFTFSSAAGNTFQCSIDRAAWKACASPLTVSGLPGGRHELRVRAVDPAGQPDPTPVSAAFSQPAPPPTTGGDGPAGGDGTPTGPGAGGTPGPVATPAPASLRRGRARAVRRIANKRLRVDTGFTLACPADHATRCAATVTLKAGKRRLARVTVRVRAGRSGRLVVDLSRSASRRLRAAGRLRVTVSVAAAEPSGHGAHAQRKLTLRAPRR